MAVTVYTRVAIEQLVIRLANRSASPLLNDMPELQRDIRDASSILATLLAVGHPIGTISIDRRISDRFPSKH
jgi:hypothetical protein